jgi:general secretion pathway protein I
MLADRGNGFTLIEVLMALAIISIACLAIVKISHSQIKNTEYLEQKTYANWVAMNAMARLSLGLVLPPVNHQTMRMLGKDFIWSATKTPTPDPRVDTLMVQVSQAPQQPPLLSLQGFINDDAAH